MACKHGKGIVDAMLYELASDEREMVGIPCNKLNGLDRLGSRQPTNHA